MLLRWNTLVFNILESVPCIGNKCLGTNADDILVVSGAACVSIEWRLWTLIICYDECENRMCVSDAFLSTSVFDFARSINWLKV